MALIDKASLLMVPSTYEAGKLYNVLPSGNRAPDSTNQNSGYDQTRADFDFDRGSNASATRVNASGLIEKGRENLLTYSNDFSQWSNSGTTETSGQADKDGGTDAWLLTKSTADGYIYQNISQSGVQTYSVYLKANALNWARIQLNGSGADKYAYFDLANGLIGGSGSGNIDENIESVGNGWYRCSIVADTTSTRVRIYPADGDNDVSGTTGSIYIQSAQLESGLVASSYLESTSVTAKAGVLVDLPRINYDANGENGALLLEPSRQNLLPYSEYFGAWNKTNQGTGIAPILSIGGNFPLGYGKYYNLQCNLNGGTTSSDRSYISLSGLSGTQFTAAKSIWIKNNSASEAVLFVGINFAADKFTLAPNADWQRITIDGGVINSEFRIGLGGGSSQSDTIDVSIFGAQCEAGSYSTSYIPTMGTSETRAADSITADGTGLTSTTKGSIFVDFNRGATSATTRDASNDGLYFRSDNFPGTDSFEIATDTDGSVRFSKRVNSSFFGFYTDNSTDRYKCVFKWNAGAVKFYVNGTQEYTSGSGFNITNVLDEIGYSPDFKKSVTQIALFNEEITDAEAITLTTL